MQIMPCTGLKRVTKTTIPLRKYVELSDKIFTSCLSLWNAFLYCVLKDKPKNMILLETIMFLVRQLHLETKVLRTCLEGNVEE